MTADPTPLERLAYWNTSQPVGQRRVSFEVLEALLDRAGLCKTCRGTGILTPPDPKAIGIREWSEAVDEWRKGCECVTRLNEAIKREIG